MNKALIPQAIIKFVFGLLFIGALLFLPAGTFHFWNAWLFIVLLFVPMLIMGCVLAVKTPELLAKRLNSEEKEPEQRSIIALSGFVFIGGFITAALDFRFKWSQLPA